MARGARKTVTVVFIDLAGSTRLAEELDPEALRRVVSRYFDTVSHALERHGGTVEKFIGDAVMAVFGIPAVHEDDALRAVRAAVEVRRVLEALSDELEEERGVRIQIRTGVNTGEVFTGDSAAGHALVTGDAVTVAARLEQAAGPGEILIGDTTRLLVREAARLEPVGSLALRGRQDETPAWRLHDVSDRAAGFARRLDSPLVGRDGELAQLGQAFERAVEERITYLFTLLGAAGIGKSRLAGELTASVSEAATVVSGRCLPYGEGITFWPLAEIMQELGGDDPRGAITDLLAGDEAADLVAERITAAIGRADAPGTAEETFWAVRRLFEALARRRPLVVVFEDIHWAEPTFLDLIEHVAEWSRDAPIVLLCLARPELLDERAGWGGGKLNATSILLEPLTEAESDVLIDNLLGEAALTDAVRAEIAHAAEGNPLFVEQMLAMLAETGAPERGLDIPPTIQALLAARLDRLARDEREAIERASVVGKRFWLGAVVDLSPKDDRAEVAGSLQRLVRKELVRPDRSFVPGEDGYRFRHILIRDAAYAGIPKETRAELHERFADWIEANAGERLTEVEEILGYHLEQAFLYRSELGAAGEHGERLAARAAERLTAAGRRALARGDVSGGASLLGRAASLLPRDAAGRKQLLPELGTALVFAGDLAEADAVFTEAVEAGTADGNRGLELHARLEQAFVRTLTHQAGGIDELRRVAERAIPEFEVLGDELGLARAWRRIADVHWMTYRWNEQERALERALVHAERAGDAREAAGSLMRLAMALYYGPTPVPEAIRRAEEILEQARGNRIVQSTFLASLGGLHAMCGRFAEARDLVARARALFEELGLRVWLAGVSLLSSDIEMLAGEPAAAEAELRRAYEALAGMGERGLLSTVTAQLARAVYAQGRFGEADELTEASEGLAEAKDVAAQVSWRATRAKLLARQSEFDEAEALALEAVRISEGTDSLASRGAVLMDLADVLERAGRTADAAPLRDRAIRLFEQKGNVVGVARARAVAPQPAT